MAIGIFLAALCALACFWERRSHPPSDRDAPPETRAVSSAGAAPATSIELEAAHALQPERSPAAASAREDAIRGRVLFPGEVSCGAGLVFAWPDGVVPRGDWFRDPTGGGPVRRASVQPDGTFCIAELPRATRFTLGAVARGALCVVRPTGVAPGTGEVTLRLWFTYGVAVRLEELGGGPLRTSPGLFGKGPLASGPGNKVLVDPVELQSLGITGLEPGLVERDRWQYLLVSEEDSPARGPIEHEVEVPGYLPRKTTLFAPRLLDRLEEIVVALEPRDVVWSELSVRVTGAPQLLPLGLAPDALLGVVYLTPVGEREPMHFGVHARALEAWEPIAGIPSGAYEAYFEAADADYQTEPSALTIGSDQNELELDFGDAATLVVDARSDDLAYDQRFVARVEDEDGAHSYVTFDRGPYVVPTLFPGVYRLTELEAPGRTCSATLGELEVFAGRLSVARIECRSAN